MISISWTSTKIKSFVYEICICIYVRKKKHMVNVTDGIPNVMQLPVESAQNITYRCFYFYLFYRASTVIFLLNVSYSDRAIMSRTADPSLTDA